MYYSSFFAGQDAVFCTAVIRLSFSSLLFSCHTILFSLQYELNVTETESYTPRTRSVRAVRGNMYKAVFFLILF